jgi:hypothetical protein
MSKEKCSIIFLLSIFSLKLRKKSEYNIDKINMYDVTHKMNPLRALNSRLNSKYVVPAYSVLQLIQYDGECFSNVSIALCAT